MFKKILVPLDRGNRHGPALKIAAELAQPGNADIFLVHVIEVIAGLSMDEERPFYDRLERSANKHLERYGSQLGAQSIPWQGKVIYGHRAPEIARFAAATGCDLMVLTSPRLDPANPGTDWGSLSYKVSVLAPCPVLLVKS